MIIERTALNSIRNDVESLGFEHFGISAKSFIESFENDIKYVLFCSVKDGGVAGYLIISTVCDEAEVIQIAVKKELMRKGVASELMSECFEYLKEKGVNSLFLEVRASNTAAVSFYEKKGFIQAGMRKRYYSDPVEDAVMMKKDLCCCCR